MADAKPIALEDMADEVTFTLRKPLTDGAVTVETITLREPTAREIAQANTMANGAESNIKLVSLVSGTSKHLVDKMAISDLNKAVTWLSNFINAAPEIGAT